MRKHCGNCANYKKETSQFSEECGKCVSARLENGEKTDPSHWREKPMTNADRIRAATDIELESVLLAVKLGYAPWCDHHCVNEGDDGCDNCIKKWLQQPAELPKGE